MPLENASKIIGVLENGFFWLHATYSTKDTDAMREMLALVDPESCYDPDPAEVVELNADHVVLRIDPNIRAL